MTMLMDYGVYGAKRQTWRGQSARAILQKMLEKDSAASTRYLAEAMLPKLDSDKIALEILEYWVANTRRSLLTPKPKNPEEKRKEAAEVDEAIRKTKYIWYAQVMKMTFGEFARAIKSPGASKLSNMGKPSQVIGNILSLKQVGDILGT